MKEKLSLIFKNIAFTCLVLNFILLPVFFLPLTTDYYNFNKLIAFLLLTAIGLISWLLYNVTAGIVRLTLSPLLLPLSLFTVVNLISTYINVPHTDEVWLNFTALYIGLFIFFILVSTLVQTSQQVRKIINYFVFVVIILGLLGSLSILGVFNNLSLPAYLTAKNFTPAGSLLNLATLLIITLPITLILAFKSQLGPNKLKYFLASGIILSSLTLIGFQILPGRPYGIILLPQTTSWSISVDTLKNNLFFGAGPANFINQFTQLKPVNVNLTPLWSVNFSAASNLYLNLLTTLGITGLFTFGALIYRWSKLVKRDPSTRITSTQMAVNFSLVTLMILGLFLPFTNLTWILLIGWLALSVSLDKTKNFTKVTDVVLTLKAITLIAPNQPAPVQKPSSPSGLLPWILALPVSAGIILYTFTVSKIYAAEYFFQKSLAAAALNQGKTTYDLQVKAINLAPTVDRYRSSYSNVNLALANALASQANLTDQDKQTVSGLLQQAVNEAKTATQLNPNKAANWQNLANVYRQLINFAQGADNFASAAYIRAIQLDPANPQLRIEFGGLMYSLNQFDTAISRFQEAIQLKPDLANAYYNLANAYLKQNKFLEAYQAMQQVVALIPADSPDYSKAQTELSDIKAKLPATKETQASPQPAASPTLQAPKAPPAAPTNFDKIPLESPTP